MWPFRHRLSSSIRVRFVDDRDGTLIDTHDVPVDRLPAEFGPETTVHVGDEDWLVVSASPTTAAQYQQSGKLLLRVRRVEVGLFDPQDILFSLPTVSDHLPATSRATPGHDVLQLHEDDWRQLEWVVASESKRVAEEIAAIRAIYELERVGNAFRKMHVRSSLRRPLAAAAITLDMLKEALGERSTWLDAVALPGAGGAVRDGFAIRTASAIELYGVASADGVVECAAFPLALSASPAQEDTQRLAAFAVTHDLLLVDWLRGRVLSPEPSAYRGLFRLEG